MTNKDNKDNKDKNKSYFYYCDNHGNIINIKTILANYQDCFNYAIDL